jgi:hypothetical protein
MTFGMTRGRAKSGPKFDDVIYGCHLTTETEEQLACSIQGLRTVVVVVNEGNAVKVSRAKCSTFTIENQSSD